MSLTLDDLNNGGIYLEAKEILAKRIDFAWSIYSDDEKYQHADKEEALKFLIYALDIRDPKNLNAQLIQLMEERAKFQESNPEYIPGKLPTRLPFDPRMVIPMQTRTDGEGDINEVNRAIQSKELLDVNADSKNFDRSRFTIFLTPEERAAHRINISGGQFKKNGKVFDTSEMRSHDKQGFAAYTLNANGEFSAFIHNRMKDRFAHSSMNAGSPVVAAGEIKIEHGVLKAITTHSGHYRPSLFNVYRLLEHLSENNVDISQAKVVTFINPSNSLSDVSSTGIYSKVYGTTIYETPAVQIYKDMNSLINENIASVNAQVKSYKEGGIITSLFKLKDKLMGSDLTEKRAFLASEFESELNLFKESLVDKYSTTELKTKIIELDALILKYQDKNKLLSSEYKKDESSGRLNETVSKFKDKLTELKSEKQTIEYKPEESNSMKGIR